MSADPDRKPYGGLRKVRLFISLLLGVTLVYVGWLFLGRWQENREIEERAAAKKRAEDQRAVEMLGGERFEILSFYASPGVIRRSETAQLCYGVSNSKAVRLEPQTSPVWPSFSRCVEVTPKKDTIYTLTAEDARGNIKTATVAVQVR